MSIFSVTTLTEPAKLAEKVESVFEPENRLKLPGTQVYFLSYKGTTSELQDKLDLKNGTLGVQAVVTQISGYGGWAPNSVWEWLKSRWATNGGE